MKIYKWKEAGLYVALEEYGGILQFYDSEDGVFSSSNLVCSCDSCIEAHVGDGTLVEVPVITRLHLNVLESRSPRFTSNLWHKISEDSE